MEKAPSHYIANSHLITLRYLWIIIIKRLSHIPLYCHQCKVWTALLISIWTRKSNRTSLFWMNRLLEAYGISASVTSINAVYLRPTSIIMVYLLSIRLLVSMVVIPVLYTRCTRIIRETVTLIFMLQLHSMAYICNGGLFSNNPRNDHILKDSLVLMRISPTSLWMTTILGNSLASSLT